MNGFFFFVAICVGFFILLVFFFVGISGLVRIVAHLFYHFAHIFDSCRTFIECFQYLHYIHIYYIHLTRSFYLCLKFTQNLHCVKNVRIRSFAGPYFPASALNKERYSVSLIIRSQISSLPNFASNIRQI